MDNQVIEFGRQEQDNLVRTVTLMNEVAKRIKTIPELPSEAPTESHGLTKVEFGDETDIFTYMEGYDYPYRGYPFYQFVDKIDAVKKLIRQTQSGFYHALKGKWYRWLLILLIPFLGKQIFWAYTYTFSRLVDRTPMRVNRFSQAVREIYRAFSVVYSDENKQTSELRKMLRDVECMILEFDNAYRFRVQDLVPELDKEELRKNPIKEVCRCIDIWIQRERVVDVKNTWELLKIFTKYYLRFDKKLLNIFVRVLLELDIEKVKLTDEDKYFAVPRKDYDFGFVLKPSEADTKLIKKVHLQSGYEEKTGLIKKQSTAEHQAVGETQKKEQAKMPASRELAQKIVDETGLLKTRLQIVQQQNQQEFEKAEKEIQAKYLTQEQKDMLTKQQAEIKALDEKYEAQLTEAKTAYLLEKASI